MRNADAQFDSRAVQPPSTGPLPATANRSSTAPKWLRNFGMAYDTSAVDDSDRGVTVPMNESWRVGAGATYQWNQKTDINFSWDLVWMGDMSVDKTKALSGQRLAGEYSSAWIQTLGGSVTWRF